MSDSGLQKIFGAVLVTVLVTGLFSGPAGADTFSITNVTQAQDAYGLDVVANLTPPEHAGTMKITLLKKTPNGWRKIATKTASDFLIPGAFFASFNKVRGQKTCRAKAVFTAPEHTPATKRIQFSC